MGRLVTSVADVLGVDMLLLEEVLGRVVKVSGVGDPVGGMELVPDVDKPVVEETLVVEDRICVK